MYNNSIIMHTMPMDDKLMSGYNFKEKRNRFSKTSNYVYLIITFELISHLT